MNAATTNYVNWIFERTGEEKEKRKNYNKTNGNNTTTINIEKL